jgi:hypothetical protein
MLTERIEPHQRAQSPQLAAGNLQLLHLSGVFCLRKSFRKSCLTLLKPYLETALLTGLFLGCNYRCCRRMATMQQRFKLQPIRKTENTGGQD